ncbi:MAG: UvrD-helicase domain-containing protein [Chlamydiales bacterium]
MIRGVNTFDVLSRKLRVPGHRFLEASAGTGKTFAIEHLVVRLLIEEKLPLEQILVVTFTRAATRELKMRIRACIESAASALKIKTAGFDYLSRILEEGEESCQGALNSLKDALACFDRAQIFTIHGFCYRMLQEFAFEADLAFDLANPDDGNASSLRNTHEQIYAFLRSGFKPPLYSLSQIEAVMQKHQFDVHKIVLKIAKILERKRALSSSSSFQKMHAQFNTALSGVSLLEKDKWLDDLRKLAPHFKRVDLASAEKQLVQLQLLIQKRNSTEEEFDALLREKNWFLETFLPENLKKRAALPHPSELNYPGIFDELGRWLLPLWQETKDPLKTLVRMACDCESSSSHALSFDELLEKMRDSLENPKFCTHVQSRFRALIVDEFQDTDPIQWQIFETLFLKDPALLSALYLVGDPKQSIYRFRGADVYTYLNAALHVKESASLNTNFRARKSLIHALNTLFSHIADGKWLPLPSLAKFLSFMPVEAPEGKKEDKLEDGKGAVHFFIAKEAIGRERNFPTRKMEETFFFPFIAQEIQAIATRGYSFRSCAILIKDRFQGERLQNYLKKVGIPSTTTRGRNLIGSNGFMVMQQFLEAERDPSNIKLLLAGPVFGCSYDEINHPAQADLVHFLQASSQKFDENGFPLFFAEFLRFVWQGKTVLERVMQIEDLYQELRGVAEFIMEEKSGGSCEELILFLQEMKARGEERLMHFPEREAVSLLTTHMSKGLEFEFVFALGLSSRHTLREELIFIRENGVEKIEELGSLHSASSELYLNEQDAEKMRQLYVALTRAKIRVYVPLAFDLSPAELGKGEGAPIELFFSQEKTEDAACATLETLGKRASISYTRLAKSMMPQMVKRDPPPLIAPQEVQVTYARRSLLSFSILAKKNREIDTSRVVPAAEGKSVHTLPLGAETGTVLHEIFEEIFKQKIFNAQHSQGRTRLITQRLAKSPLEGWEEVVIEIVDSALKLPLFREKSFSLENLAEKNVIQEMEFLFSFKGNLVKGCADLLFEWEEKYYLLDWKSNWLGPDEASYIDLQLEQTMHENDYFLQGAIYAAAFERYVKLFDRRPFEKLFGGAFYIFLRGKKTYHFTPDGELLERAIGTYPTKIANELAEDCKIR